MSPSSFVDCKIDLLKLLIFLFALNFINGSDMLMSSSILYGSFYLNSPLPFGLFFGLFLADLISGSEILFLIKGFAFGTLSNLGELSDYFITFFGYTLLDDL